MLKEVGEARLGRGLVESARANAKTHGHFALWRGVVHDGVAHAVRQNAKPHRRIGGNIGVRLRPVVDARRIGYSRRGKRAQQTEAQKGAEPCARREAKYETHQGLPEDGHRSATTAA